MAAVVVPRPGVQLTERAVGDHARARLAGDKTPKHVVVTDALPESPSGKILTRRLREEHARTAAGA